jgi:hypothetical protein
VYWYPLRADVEFSMNQFVVPMSFGAFSKSIA